MPQNIFKFTGNKVYGANRLFNVSKRIVDLAFFMGGTHAIYYQAIPCNYVFPDGTPCRNTRGSNTITCPLCQGTGAYYNTGIDTPLIISDSAQPLFRDKFGAIFTDKMTISVPAVISPRMLELEGNNVKVARDKFVVKTLSDVVWAVLYVDSEPNDSFLGGTLYHIVNVISHLVFEDYGDQTGTPEFLSDPQARDIFKQVSSDVLGISTDGDFVKLENSQAVIDNGKLILAGPETILSKWK